VDILATPHPAYGLIPALTTVQILLSDAPETFVNLGRLYLFQDLKDQQASFVYNQTTYHSSSGNSNKSHILRR
jgi:hypothetical protein